MANRMLLYEKEQRCEKGCRHLEGTGRGGFWCRLYNKPIMDRLNRDGERVAKKVSKCKHSRGKKK